MIKLRSILNEIKLVPHNRILLRQDNTNNERYFLIINGIELGIRLEELQNGIIIWPSDIEIINALDSKKIKYEINNDDIYVNAKYFIPPDKINEVKQIPIQLYKQLEEDIEKLYDLAEKMINNHDEWELDSELSSLLNQYNIGDYDFEELINNLSIDQVKELNKKLIDLYNDYGG